MHLTGFLGQIRHDGIISLLSILQAPHPANADLEIPETPQIQKLLRTPYVSISATRRLRLQQSRADVELSSNQRASNIFSLCARRANRQITLSRLHLAYDKASIPSLRRISAYIVEGRRVWTIDNNGKFGEQTIHDIPAFRVEFNNHENGEENWYKHKLIGYPPEQLDEDGSVIGEQGFRDEYWKHFDIDGLGGELVTEVLVAQHGDAVVLKTNRWRKSFWGGLNGSRLNSLTAPEGEMLVGLVASFGEPSGGRLSGVDYGMVSYSELKTTAISAVTMALHDVEMKD